MLFAVAGTRFHHGIEDRYYWPALIEKGADPSALEPLMVEHQGLDPMLDELESEARALRKDVGDTRALGAVSSLFASVGDHMLTHLDNEEPIFFPLMAQYLSDDEAHTLSSRAVKDSPRFGTSWLMGGATYVMRPQESAEFLHAVPKPVLWLRPLFLRRYRKNCVVLGIEPTTLSPR
jgi:hypothetical protein